MHLNKVDVLIIGGGIVGLATGFRISQRFPHLTITMVEKESELAKHQSGRNSGVLHSGIYYKPGSKKAINCHRGREAMVAFCKEHGIAHEICGKVIVATTDEEIGLLKTLYERGKKNNVDCEWISAEQLREREPHCAGLAAVHVSKAGIVDYVSVCHRLGQLLCERGHQIHTGTRLLRVKEAGRHSIAETTQGSIEAKWIINCAGLHSDRVASSAGFRPDSKIVPFRGEYYELSEEARSLCQNLIYPVPDPSFPFLGVHFTRMISGKVECGPNAVLAFAREGYSRWDINPSDVWEYVRFRGFHRLTARHWRRGFDEMYRSWSRSAFLASLQRLIPTVQSHHLLPVPSGIRAQALKRDGNLVDDFVIETSGKMINVLNAPSPAATSSLNIASTIVDNLSNMVAP